MRGIDQPKSWAEITKNMPTGGVEGVEHVLDCSNSVKRVSFSKYDRRRPKKGREKDYTTCIPQRRPIPLIWLVWKPIHLAVEVVGSKLISDQRRWPPDLRLRRPRGGGNLALLRIASVWSMLLKLPLGSDTYQELLR